MLIQCLSRYIFFYLCETVQPTKPARHWFPMPIICFKQLPSLVQHTRRDSEISVIPVDSYRTSQTAEGGRENESEAAGLVSCQNSGNCHTSLLFLAYTLPTPDPWFSKQPSWNYNCQGTATFGMVVVSVFLCIIPGLTTALSLTATVPLTWKSCQLNADHSFCRES